MSAPAPSQIEWRQPLDPGPQEQTEMQNQEIHCSTNSGTTTTSTNSAVETNHQNHQPKLPHTQFPSPLIMRRQLLLTRPVSILQMLQVFLCIVLSLGIKVREEN
jgi:hypothetical protein